MVPSSDKTFVFCDIAGWTALTAERGDEFGADVAIGMRERAGRLLASHRAHEVKALGDGLMLVGDDVGAAVRLSVRLAHCCEFPLHVGVHTGPAIFHDGDWYGTAVNVAARLCTAARAGQVLVSSATLWAAGHIDGVRYGDVRLYTLRHLGEAVPAQLVARAPRFARGRFALVRSRPSHRHQT